jgi:hypothetical protein
MSQQLISRSPDLKRLRDEGYDVEIRSGHLLVKDVPYVGADQKVKRGIFVSTLTMAGDVTAPPDTHVAMFVGEYPCDKDGRVLDKIRSSGGQTLAEDLAVDYQFSSKPAGGAGYEDYYEKMTAYVAIVLSHAQAIDPRATAKTFPVIEADEDDSVFNYMDTASSRAGINLATKKLELGKVAIIGVGGTGSYILDLLAKTPVMEIHLFDGDDFLSHNAFRTPGAASVDELRAKPKKTALLRDRYALMRRGIVDHPYNVDASNVAEVRDMDFVFLCIDAGEAKKTIVENLEAFGLSFIDVGMGVNLVDESLQGVLRVTTSTQEWRDHFRTRASLADAGVDDAYEHNIQVADLNALNAALAVIKWKRMGGFYLDYRREYNSSYTLDSNMLLNDDCDEA